MFDLSRCANVSANSDGAVILARENVSFLRFNIQIQYITNLVNAMVLGVANVLDKLMKTTHPPGTGSSGSLPGLCVFV